MLIGVPKEIKTREYRVGLLPDSVKECLAHGHNVIVETQAGAGIGFSDADYIAAGATVVSTASEIFAKADMIVKVKEPQPQECGMLRKNQILFTYLHLAPDPVQADLLEKSGCIAIAYETVTQDDGGLPLLLPMSQVAGRMAIQAGAHSLEKAQGGRGVLLGGVPGVAPANVVIIGGGIVGTNAARMAMGMESRVTILDKNLSRLLDLDLQFGSKISTIFATQTALEQCIKEADLVVCAVLVAGGATPKLITRKMLKTMRKHSVIVDVAIDQGGACETSRATTHDEPTYVEEDVVHYCVANMPGAVPHTSTYALNNATLPFVLAMANKGVKNALLQDAHLMNGLNVCQGHFTHKAVADALGKVFTDPRILLA